MKIKFLQLVVLCNLSCSVLCFDPFSMGYLGYTIGAVGIGLITKSLLSNEKHSVVRQIIKKGCVFIGYCEGCESKWIAPNLQELRRSFDREVFGQKLATEKIMEILDHHFNGRGYNKKALLLSFHGTPGVGKNLVSNLILKNLFHLGGKTSFVKFFRGSIDFPENDDIYRYMDKVRTEVRSRAKECFRSIFVFDEVDKMPSEVLNALKTFIRTDSREGEVDYRDLIFIFLSNLASRDIGNIALSMYMNKEGPDSYDFHTIIKDVVVKTKGGYFQSEIINYVDHFIPFLPLTKNDVYNCLEVEVRKEGQIMSQELYNQLIDELVFEPDDLEIFSVHGCKSIAEKAGALIHREVRKKQKLKYNTY